MRGISRYEHQQSESLVIVKVVSELTYLSLSAFASSPCVFLNEQQKSRSGEVSECLLLAATCMPSLKMSV